ncbi:hypothetical protein BDZ94DRAFT_1301588 [Collybia nuda]|uniref:DUF6533 domain-containing protein n=1 Tax=Collybia nuda TaxID=64659 RepID=A0A9P5XUC0_9AGAR|nr:hypothetical protein BDZ94DRAFT_1301588 [Collybia nuda]
MTSTMAGPEVSIFIHDRIVTRYATLASVTLLVWDTLLTMDQQVSRVWFAKPTIGRTLFIINRYLPIVLMAYQVIYLFYTPPSIEVCEKGFLISGLGGVVNFWTIQSVLITRIYALYQKRYLVALLLFLSFASTVAMATILIYLFVRFMFFLPLGSLPIPGCTPLCIDPLCETLMRSFSIPFFVLEAAILLLTVYKTLETLKRTGWKHLSHLSQIVYRDGLIYYLVIVLVAALNVILWLRATSSLGDLGQRQVFQSLLLGLQSTICSRLFLNIREVMAPRQSFVYVFSGAFETLQQHHRSQGGEYNTPDIDTHEIEMIIQK